MAVTTILSGCYILSKFLWKTINDGFMYVCVAEKCEVIVFSTVVSIDNFPPSLGKKPKMMVFKDVCMCKAKTFINGFFSFFMHLSLTSMDPLVD